MRAPVLWVYHVQLTGALIHREPGIRGRRVGGRTEGTQGVRSVRGSHRVDPPPRRGERCRACNASLLSLLRLLELSYPTDKVLGLARELRWKEQGPGPSSSLPQFNFFFSDGIFSTHKVYVLSISFILWYTIVMSVSAANGCLIH